MRQAFVVVGLGFGDEGKGSVVDYLVRRYAARTVVRYNGGPQAGHNVVTPDGRHHTFSQFGSGTFVPGVQTHLSQHMLVAPVAMLREAAHLAERGVSDALQRLTIDEDATVVTPFQRATNRLRELSRGAARHGSCGMGVGDAVVDRQAGFALLVGDLMSPSVVRRKLAENAERKYREVKALALPTAEKVVRERRVFDSIAARDETIEDFVDACLVVAKRARVVGPGALRGVLGADGAVVFEGAQGVLLDEAFGFHPYTTWAKTTTVDAEESLNQLWYDGAVTKLGVLRAYATRHGPGPFPTEDGNLTRVLADLYNVAGDWQGPLRVGWFDAVLARYAVEATGGVDGLVLTCLDQLPLLPGRVCDRYLSGGVTEVEAGELALPRTLGQQEQLTARLLKCVGAYRALSSRDAGVFCREVERLLGVPVAFGSYGPTADQKGSALLAAGTR